MFDINAWTNRRLWWRNVCVSENSNPKPTFQQREVPHAGSWSSPPSPPKHAKEAHDLSFLTIFCPSHWNQLLLFPRSSLMTGVSNIYIYIIMQNVWYKNLNYNTNKKLMNCSGHMKVCLLKTNTSFSSFLAIMYFSSVLLFSWISKVWSP